MKNMVIKLSLIMMILLTLTGCSGSSLYNGETNVQRVSSKYCDMEIIEKCDNNIYIYRDKNTNVLYLAVGGYNSFGLTPILDSDGTPIMYEKAE